MSSLRLNTSYTLISNNEDEEANNSITVPLGTMGHKLDKFLLLMWKNWLLQYRKPVQTLIEILAPVFFSILLVVIRSLVEPELHENTIYKPFLTFPNFCQSNNGSSSLYQNLTLYYSPTTSKGVVDTMKIFELAFGEVQGFESSTKMELYLASSMNNLTFAAVQFPNNVPDVLLPTQKIDISLRFPGELRTDVDLFNQNNWHTNLIFPIFQMPGPRKFENNFGATPNYFKEGFLTLQHVISVLVKYGATISARLEESAYDPNDMNICSILDGLLNGNYSGIPPEYAPIMQQVTLIGLQRFPYGRWQEDLMLQPLITFAGLLMILSFVYTCINTVKTITTEKEKQLKEAMKIMGLSNWLHWTAWFVKSMGFLIISIVFIVILLKIKWYPKTDFAVFTFADPSVMLVFLFLYMCSTITFCFAISVFFSKANTAATIAGLAWFLSYSPYLFLQDKYDVITLSTKLGASLGSNTAMAYGFQLMLMYEGTGEGIQWNNAFKPSTPDDDLHLGLIMIMLIFDTFLYLLIALYVEAVFPGEYGVPQPWYFPLTAKFWCGQPRSTGVENFSEITNQPNEFFEKAPQNLVAGVQIKELRKVFDKKTAVRGLSLNMYEDQITVLLGHNGAGKTTTMSMLTGMFPPTSGTAVVSGHDIRTDMEGVRRSLGLCPQHNIIFDELSVKEHLYFFSKLKGLKKESINSEIDKYVNLLELVPKANAKACTLSGGMKRKLCVAMALCGNSKVVMLDEPTAGMDPSARRALWDLLLSQKEGRTILLSTHFMDEADLLGDRIAIMAGGELQCCGSSFFLKKKYGAGYHLIMDKSHECDVRAVTNLLKRHIPNIEVHSNIGSELTYLLVESQSAVFETVLEDLEQHSEELGIRSYGISLTTLEEVFMKVGADHGQEETYNEEANDKVPSSATSDRVINGTNNILLETKVNVNQANLLSGFALIQNQFLAMLMKKSLSTMRTWILLLIQIAIPALFLIITMLVSRATNRTGNLPAMPLSLNKFSNPVTLVSGSNDHLEPYKDLITHSGHIVKEVDNITDYMIKLTEETPATARRRYIVGAEFDVVAEFDGMKVVKTWFNNDPYHSPGIALGLVLNAVYNTSINFINHPLPYTTDSKVKELLRGNSMGFQLAFNIGFSMAFVSSFYVLFSVRERVSKSKHLQFVSGVKVLVFWSTTLLCDMITYLLTTIILIITLIIFQENGYKTADELGRIFLILFYFGWSMLPMMYIASYFFEVPATGYTRMCLFSIFTGNAAFLVVQILATPGFDLEYVANALHWIFLAVPHYSLSTGIRDTYLLFAYNQICDLIYESCQVQFPSISRLDCFKMSKISLETCGDVNQNYFKWKTPGIGRNLLYSFLGGVVLFLVVLLKEYKIFSKLVHKVNERFFQKYPEEILDDDQDVKEEKTKIRNALEQVMLKENIVVLRDVTKYYKDFLAVNSICLGVKKYECFGLLGVNGAGKTTTFKMMTGDIKISYGDAWVNGHNLKHDLENVQKLIGYCPQFDALLDDMTARESLTMFSLLRGVPLDETKYLGEKLAKDFDFHRHLDKQVKELSGGNKRKLSTAIALIGDPPVIYLDEPTTGMDPATKRYLWNALCQVRDSGKCIVLTSHSMEECEALCTRLAIMVNGNFKCLGSTQHLKNKFAEGYTLTIKIKKLPDSAANDNSETEQIEKFIQDNFPGAKLHEKHQELLNYYITDKSLKWSRMFGILETAKRRDLNIEDYSIGQSSLEQVFLSFTKQQS